ncbi:MAG: LuxR C-terminal-related transcriptional regulator [Isosphaeraceae bacterium]
MSHSEVPSRREVRAAVRVAGEVRELGESPQAWKRHLGERALRLVGGKVAVLHETALKERAPDRNAGTLDLGWKDERERQGFLDYIARFASREYEEIPYWPAFWDLVATKRLFTVSRRRLVTDHGWYGSDHVHDGRRRADVDDFIYSIFVLPDLSGTHHLCLHRHWGDAPFGRRERKVIHILHTELARSWSGPARPDPFAGMAPRWRQTLALLLGGSSEKQVASRLGLSRNTVHHYVVALHRHFNVGSRGELLARVRAITESDRRRPRLWLADLRRRGPGIAPGPEGGP